MTPPKPAAQEPERCPDCNRPDCLYDQGRRKRHAVLPGWLHDCERHALKHWRARARAAEAALRSREPIIWINAHPDEDYPRRILEAHLEVQTSSVATDNVMGLPRRRRCVRR